MPRICSFQRRESTALKCPHHQHHCPLWLFCTFDRLTPTLETDLIPRSFPPETVIKKIIQVSWPCLHSSPQLTHCSGTSTAGMGRKVLEALTQAHPTGHGTSWRPNTHTKTGKVSHHQGASRPQEPWTWLVSVAASVPCFAETQNNCSDERITRYGAKLMGVQPED